MTVPTWLGSEQHRGSLLPHYLLAWVKNTSPPALLDSVLVLLRTPSYRCASDATDQPSFQTLDIHATDKAAPFGASYYSPLHDGIQECWRSACAVPGAWGNAGYLAMISKLCRPKLGFAELYAPPLCITKANFSPCHHACTGRGACIGPGPPFPLPQSSDFLPLEEWDRGRGVDGLEVDRPSPAASIGLAFSLP